MHLSLKDAEAFEQFMRDLLKRVHVPGDREVGALFSVAYALPSGEEPYFLTGRCVFEQDRAPPRRHEYPELLLDEWWAGTEEAVASLVEVMKGNGKFNGIGMPGFYVPSAQRELGERPSVTGWPEWILRATTNRGARTHGPPSDPVVHPGYRPYSSGVQAIIDWVWRAPTKNESHQPHDNTLVIAVPDYRSRIKSAEWRSRTVTFEVESSECDVELQSLVLAGGTHRPLSPASDPAKGSPAALEVPEGTERVELFLVRSTGDLADHVTLHSSGEEFEAAAGEPTPEERALTELRNGEGHEVEFKPFIPPKEPKEEEIVRTVVAFANTQGGRLYIGVRDEGVPEGESALCRASHADAATGLKLLADRVQTLVREKVKPVPDVIVHQVRVFGEPIIVVAVPASPAGPFSTHDNDVFIRKGATNRKPDPRTELPHIGSGAGNVRLASDFFR